MTTWRENKAWADKFLPEMKRIVGEHLIGEAPEEEDWQRNTDLIVLTMRPLRIACRVRRHEFLAQHADEFTMRAECKSGNKTELAKVVEGWGDYMLYAFADADEKGLARWTLIDLNAFRLWFVRHLAKNAGKMPGREYWNKDGRSKLRAFRLEMGLVFRGGGEEGRNGE